MHRLPREWAGTNARYRSQAAEARRVEALARATAELSQRLDARLTAVESSADVSLAADRHLEVRRLADAARQAGDRASADSLASLENALGAVQELEREVATRAAERERQLQAAERNRNAEPGARKALAALQHARAAVDAAGAPRGA